MREKQIRSLGGTLIGIIVAVLGGASALSGDVGQANSADEPIVVTSKIYPAVGREDELEARLIQVARLVKKLEPEITFRLQRSSNEPVFFVLYQIYPSQEALDKHRTQTMQTVRKELGPPPEGITARLSEIEYFRVLAN